MKIQNSDLIENEKIDLHADNDAISRRKVLESLLACVVLGAIPSAAQESVKRTYLRFGKTASVSVPRDFVGLSYETAQLADSKYFSSDNHELISLFRNLGHSGVLRIGGNSSEFCWWKTKSNETAPVMPSSSLSEGNWMPQRYTAIEPLAIDRLAGFLDATGWSAIYGLNLGTGTPERDAEEAAYVANVLGARLLYFQIGNEPEYYSNDNTRLRSKDWNFDRYWAQWKEFAQAVIQRVPHARFGGPDVGSNEDWVIQFAERAVKEMPGRIAACTGHFYAEGPPDSPTTTVARLLGRNQNYDNELDHITSTATRSGIAYRMTEGNSCYRGGKPGLSDAFCSTLWAAEFMLNLAIKGAAGVNFHGGGSKQIRMSLGGHLPGEDVAPKSTSALDSFYTPIAGSRNSRYVARPVFYGMKLAGLLAGGRMRQARLEGPSSEAVAWVAEMPNGETRVVVLNKSQQSELVLWIASAHSARLWRIEAPSLAATSGVTFAGAAIAAGKQWQPRREDRIASTSGMVATTVPAVSGAVLFFRDGLV